MKVLDDIRVLDLTQFWFGPFCTMMLADMGAEVIRVEPPWGAVDRVADGALFGGSSYTFHHLNVNKKGLTLNLKESKGIKIFKSLVAKSDVIVQNFRPGTMERLGLSYDELRGINPKIIYAALSGFGQTGPYMDRPCFAPIAEAMSGHTRLTGDEADPSGPPREMAQAYGDLGPGLFAAMAIVSAIRYRDRSGFGQMIDVAQLDCMVALNTATTGYNLSGMVPWELREKFPAGKGFGGLIKTKDGGWIRLASFSPRLLDDLKAHLGVEEVTMEQINEMTAKMTRDEALNFFIEAKVPVAPVYHMSEVVEDPHLKARGMFIDLVHSSAGRVVVPNFPVKFTMSIGEVKSPAPTIGQHNLEVLQGLLGYSMEDIIELQNTQIISQTI